jgi:dipeptidyl aminopeptidase/acylaminoacyl peptidase
VSTFTVEDALAIREIAKRSYIALSPDGRYVAVTVEDSQEGKPVSGPLYIDFNENGVSIDVAPCRILVTDRQTGETIVPVKPEAFSWSPVWSPDGRQLAFYSDEGGIAGVWLYDLPSDHSRHLTGRIARPFFGFEHVRWSPDGRYLLAKVLPEGMTVEEANARAAPETDITPGPDDCTVVVLSSEPMVSEKTTRSYRNAHERYFADLVAIDVHTGDIRTIAASIHPFWFEFSPDGTHLAFMDALAQDGKDIWQTLYDLHVVSLADGQDTIVAAAISSRFGLNVSWSPDSRRLAYTTFRSSQCHVITREGTPLMTVGGTEGQYFFAENRGPLWAADSTEVLLGCNDSLSLWLATVDSGSMRQVASFPGKMLLDIVAARNSNQFWSPGDGKTAVALFRNHDDKRTILRLTDLTTGEVIQEIGDRELGRTTVFGQAVTADGNRLACIAESVTEPKDVWLLTLPMATMERGTRLNPQIDPATHGRSQLIDWGAEVGEPLRNADLRGALLLPADYTEGQRYPLIVSVYGHTGSDFVHQYAVRGARGLEFPNLQLFASRGYAVLIPDVDATGPTMMADYARCVLPAVDRVIEMGIADPDRLGVIGQSAGGYGVLSLIVETTRFRAAVASAPSGDWMTIAFHTEDGEAGWIPYAESHLGATLWEDPDRYRANSPMYFLNRVETPLLLICGGLDTTCPPYFSEQIYVGLKYLGKTVTCARYAGEDHFPGAYGRANLTDYIRRVLNWFDAYLSVSGKRNSRSATL